MTRRNYRTYAAAILLLAVGGLLALVGMAPSATRNRPMGPLAWGVYQILWSRDYGEQLTRELANFASNPGYVLFFRDLHRPFPKFAIDCIDRHGATAIVSLELWSWHGGRGDASYLPLINDGHYDAFLREWATTAKKDGRPVMLRFGFEFNGNWFSWSGDPKAYINAWQRAYDIFQKVGATNVAWVWAPNIKSSPDNPGNNMHRYYPGDRFVDWIGVDGYNFGDHHDVWHRWQSFDAIYNGVLADFQKRYPSKPVIITEFGSASGKPGQREAWIRGAFDSLKRFEQVRAAVWFNYDKRRENEPNWRIDATPGSLRVFNETFAAPKPIHP